MAVGLEQEQVGVKTHLFVVSGFVEILNCYSVLLSMEVAHSPQELAGWRQLVVLRYSPEGL